MAAGESFTGRGRRMTSLAPQAWWWWWPIGPCVKGGMLCASCVGSSLFSSSRSRSWPGGLEWAAVGWACLVQASRSSKGALLPHKGGLLGGRMGPSAGLEQCRPIFLARPRPGPLLFSDCLTPTSTSNTAPAYHAARPADRD